VEGRSFKVGNRINPADYLNMGDLSVYESRRASLSGTPAEIYNFVTDLRNLKRFVPEGTINNWQSESDTCSFNVSVVGTVSVRIALKEPFSKVIYNGDALKKNDFSLILDIANSKIDTAEVKIRLEAELNPMLKMMANKPIAQFLEILIIEMEKFRDWLNIVK
jgi:hypothetical protein